MAGESQNNPQQDVIAEEYMSSLADLTVNSKPLINMLTMLAEENVESAPTIVKVIEKHLSQVKPEMKLPVLYLVDSIVKNFGGAYTSLFTQNIVSSFCSVFEKVEESTRASMFKLRQTWSDVFPPKKLYALDVRVKSIDPAWPVTAPLPTSIHLNPAFLPKSSSSNVTKPTKPAAKIAQPAAVPTVPASDLCETEMRESLLKKQKELLELQQKKLEIELLQTKARLQQQQIQLISTVQKTPLDVVNGLPIPEETPAFFAASPLDETNLPVPPPSDAFSVPEPMELALTPPDVSIEELIVQQQPVAITESVEPHHRSSRSPEKRTEAKKDKKDRDRDRDKEPGRKKSRKDSGQEDARSKSKDSSRAPERRKMEVMKKESVVEPKKRRTNRFDDLFGNEDIDLRKVPAVPVIPAVPGVVIPPPLASRDSPPRGPWPPSKRGHAAPRGRAAWPTRGGRGGRSGPREEEDREPDGSGSPRNMDFILEQAKENHRNGVINDGEYGTIIRQVFQMSETKMIREVQRRESFSVPPGPHGPHPSMEHDFRFPGRDLPPGPPYGLEPYGPEPFGPEPFGPEQDRGWNDPRRGGGFPPGGPFPPGPGRMQRFDMIQPGRGHHGPGGMGPINSAFEVRPDEDMKTIPIDNIPREIRFYGDKAIILMAADDPRLLGFQTCVRRVLLDNMPVDCTVGNDYVDFHFDGQLHKIKIGAPTRELYIDGTWYECMFGGPPITVNLSGRPVQAILEGPPPTVKIGTERRLDLLAGRVTMIIDAHSVIPVYLDLKLQHFEMDGKVFTLQFKDALRTAVVDGNPYSVDFGGLPMGIYLDGRKHFVRFSSLPRGVEPGRVLQPLTQSEENRRVLDEEKTASQTPPLSTVNIGELLSKLVATGLLPGSTPEVAKPAPVKPEIKQEEMKMRVVDLSDSESMKVRPNVAISMLYSGMQCGSCGLRFPADQTTRKRRIETASKSYCSVSDWIQFEETEGSEEKRLNWFEAQAKEKSEKDGERIGDESTSREESTSVAVGSAPEENKCFVCHEELDQFFHEESEEWHLKDAVRVEGITFHRLCYRDHLTNMETGAYSPSDALDEYQSGNEESKTSSEDEKQASCDDEPFFELPDIKKDEIVKDLMDMQEVGLSDLNAEVPFLETEPLKIETVEEVITQDEIAQMTFKTEPVSNEIQVEVSDVLPVQPERAVETSLSSSIKTEALDVLESDYLQNATSQEIGSTSYDPNQTDFTNILEEEINKMCTVSVLKDEANLLESLDEVKRSAVESFDDVRESTVESLNVINESEKFHLNLAEVRENENLLDAMDEAPQNIQEPIEKMESTEVLEESNSPVTLTPQISGEVECRDSILNEETELILSEETELILSEETKPILVEETKPILEPMVAVVQTSTVNSSLDGNVEMTNKQPAPAPPAGIKIKINLFNKASTIASTVQQVVPPVPPPSETASVPSANIPENSSKPLIPTSDESTVTNKPRLAGRKLTVLPPMTKGVETSGLCSIM
ncbi:putative Pre-mRNA cleavage complex 2 protein Pcf11 [Daphnia magna]|uniref:Putative Pre-mRNA cleavage complex 2 protein Pcf11 n=1 Tax=Daphnia magna TaxID=35525 RepID=A0A164YN58_9CRUS|nr:putative Pre-mRNA cleavage complex 2 protein Pcf11 [Daphnia magna]